MIRSKILAGLINNAVAKPVVLMAATFADSCATFLEGSAPAAPAASTVGIPQFAIAAWEQATIGGAALVVPQAVRPILAFRLKKTPVLLDRIPRSVDGLIGVAVNVRDYRLTQILDRNRWRTS